MLLVTQLASGKFVTIKYCISTLFGVGQVAVTEVNNTDEVPECDKEILASCVSPFERKGPLLFLWTNEPWVGSYW